MVRESGSIQKPVNAIPYLAAEMTATQEHFVVLTLDGHHQVIQKHIVTIGLANQSQIHPRETFRPAIMDSAVSIIIAHNHPSGHLEPSQADLAATKKLSEAGKILGIPVIDHLIIGKGQVYSIREHFSNYFAV
jgi:DNA repair protein RadC